ncbi:MAG: flagellar hook protein FlgE [Thermotogaceae bacterium]|nr:flagellar hook protein FlgE [Thermotogaceae bacterium]MDN5337858.1 flagellar hook protein FlgE [Thermotogaceae bacterium]
MMRSMFSGITGLRNFQLDMDVIGNNIANVNTVGFKGSRTTFQTALLQTLKASSAPQGNFGGTNAMQVGLGAKVASIDKIMSQGSFQNTGKKTDLAIQGDGFFVVSDGIGNYYTRAGNFDVDTNGTLIQPSTGYKVQGWEASIDPETGRRYVDSNKPIGDIVISAGMSMAASATTKMELSGNMKADVGPQNFVMNVRDVSSGMDYEVNFRFTKTQDDINVRQNGDPFATNQSYTWEADWDGDGVADATGYIIFNEFGRVVDAAVTSGGSGDTINIAGDANIVIPTTGEPRFYEADDTSNFVVPEYISPNYVTSVQVYDSLGRPYNLYVEFIRLGRYDFDGDNNIDFNNAWVWKAYTDSGEIISYVNANGNPNTTTGEAYVGGLLDFDTSGRISSLWGIYNDGTGNFTVDNTIELKRIEFDAAHNGDGKVGIDIDFTALTQYASPFSAVVNYQNGNAEGSLQSFAINENGEIIGTFSNGLTDVLGKIALALFNNPAGLQEIGNSLYAQSSNSGLPLIGAPGSGGRGTIIPGALEMSNVDLAEEFTKMIIAQRGFQANARVITTADQILNELVNIRR